MDTLTSQQPQLESPPTDAAPRLRPRWLQVLTAVLTFAVPVLLATIIAMDQPARTVAAEAASTGHPRSDAAIAQLHPLLRSRAADALIAFNEANASEGITARIDPNGGYRSFDAQAALYDIGRRSVEGEETVTDAAPGSSLHNYGLAFDIVIFIDGAPDWSVTENYDRFADTTKRMGLAWGGDWESIVDRPHHELDCGLTTAELRGLRERGATDDDGYLLLPDRCTARLR